MQIVHCNNAMNNLLGEIYIGMNLFKNNSNQ